MKLCYCEDKCCSVIIKSYTLRNHKRRIINKKAGVFIYDSIKKKVLVIQSKGNLWGLPKEHLKKMKIVLSAQLGKHTKKQVFNYQIII